LNNVYVIQLFIYLTVKGVQAKYIFIMLEDINIHNPNTRTIAVNPKFVRVFTIFFAVILYLSYLPSSIMFSIMTTFLSFLDLWNYLYLFCFPS